MGNKSLNFTKFVINPLKAYVDTLNMAKIPVYFMPGLAASPLIFEHIRLPEDFEMHLLEWQIPLAAESLQDYARRMSVNITHKDAVLVGVSFGGILMQEVSVFVNPRKTIIISSVKSNQEMPRRMRWAKATGAYKLIPIDLVAKVDKLARFSLGSKIDERLKMYEKYLSVRDSQYLSWAIENVIKWNRAEADPRVVHIHGTKDEVFPPRYISNYIPVEGGTHVMILNRHRWMNENLPRIILQD